MRQEKYSRKRLLINRPYQVRFIAEILVVVLLATCLSTAAAWLIIQKEVDRGFFSGHRKLVSLHEALPRVLMISGMVTLAAMALLGILVTLRETHRVIGPVNRFEKKFLEMAKGDFSYMHSLRKGDVLKGLDDSINIHLNNLGDFFRAFETVMDEVVPCLTVLEKGEEDTQEAIRVIRERLTDIDRYADAFRPG